MTSKSQGFRALMALTPVGVPRRPATNADAEARAGLDAGVRYERGGSPEQALNRYQLALSTAADPGLRSEAYRRIADVHRAAGDSHAAVQAARMAAQVAAQHGLADLCAEAVNAEGNVHLSCGDVVQAEPLFERALTLAHDGRVCGIVLQNLGTCAARRGDPGAARALFERSAAQFREAGYDRGVLIALNNMAAASIEFGAPEAALPVLREASSIARDLLDLDLLLLTVQNKAEALCKLGRFSDAEAKVSEALGFFSAAGHEIRRAECYVVLGDIHAAQAALAPEVHTSVAAECYRRAAGLAARLGAVQLADRAERAGSALGERG